MPETSRATEALKNPGHASRSAAALRILIGAIFVVSVLAIPQIANPEPAVAASCTGWASITKPPTSIRVLRTRTGRIETVGFRKYVARVMASGEWPSRLRMATLEAGALATKQYAWYYSMRGNHRSHYVRNGNCYDVRDDTSDQLYKHYASPTARQWKALDKTWNLTLRKNGRFFLTGYRAGGSSTCGADANGWKLYAKSVQACANKGWSFARILNKYLGPNLKVVWSDKVGPSVAKPKVTLRAGNSLATGATTVYWHPSPRKAAVAQFQLQRRIGNSAWKTVALPRPKAWKADAWVKVGIKNRFRIRAQNQKGSWGPWSYSPGRKAAVRGPTGATLASAQAVATLAGGIDTAAVEPIKVKTRFEGHAAAIVLRTGPGMGKVKVYVDGKYVATVNLDRPHTTARKLVWAKNWSKSTRHSVAVKPLSSSAQVEFHGFVVLR
jgi:hypothetical protein